MGKAASKLTKLGITSVRALLYHFPRRYQDVAQYSSLADVRFGEYGTVLAEVVSFRGRPTRRRGLNLYTVGITDGQAGADVVFFGSGKRMEFVLKRDLAPGTRVEFSGDVDRRGGRIQFKNASYEVVRADDEFGLPQLDQLDAAPAGESEQERIQLRAFYPATSEVPNDLIRQSIAIALDGLSDGDLADPIPAEVIANRELMPLTEALHAIHRPAQAPDYRRARRRMRFEEAFILQTALARRRAEIAAHPARSRPPTSGGLVDALDAQLPFELTRGQREVAAEIAEDLAARHPMQRLLQGEVGSGKTVVALRAMLQVVDSGGQAALLAPTEVLAQQHARTISELLGPLGHAGMLDAPGAATRVALLTGSVTGTKRRAVLGELASGAAGIVVGTHALLQEHVQFADLGLTVIDEQHRFGVEQREALRAKGNEMPHQLFMTATPIPRSVAMTVFGDVEVSTLREIPAGRSPITTHVVPADKGHWLGRAWAKVAEEIGRGNRAYVVAPRISASASEEGADLLEESQSAPTPRELSNVTDTAERLAQLDVLSGIPLGVMHGRLPTEEKDAAMAAFADGTTPLLVTTTVIEVGVDVPEATVMVVLDADRFGLSQLHQLRGRVGRGSEPGLCLLVTSAEPDTEAHERLEVLARTTDGFVLAEEDLKTRREGDILGAAQSGRARSLKLLRVIADASLIAHARTDARALVAADPDLGQHPDLRRAISDLLDPERQEYLDRA